MNTTNHLGITMHHRLGALLVLLLSAFTPALGADPAGTRPPAKLQLDFDAAGQLRTLGLPGFNQLADAAEQALAALWQINVQLGDSAESLAPDRARPPRIERTAEVAQLVWDDIPLKNGQSLSVRAVARMDPSTPNLSRWELRIDKLADLRLKQIAFPRLGNLRQRPNERLAVSKELGFLMHDPRTVLQGTTRKGHRLSFASPNGTGLSLPCVAFYQDNGPGLYLSCDDIEGFRKDFALLGDGKGQVQFELIHEPENQAAGVSNFHLPFVPVIGVFEGDWTAAAAIYRESPAARAMAQKGRLRQDKVPQWARDTGLWVWNRGRSDQVLSPALALQKRLGTPVSVLWHWWHSCAYDDGFPEYLPPREGESSFKSALAAARQQGLHAIVYMNQRLWGMKTQSWASENAEPFAAKQPDGTIRPEIYNAFTKAPCATMCIDTRFWRDKYAGIADNVLNGLRADGLYMDQVGVWASCYDPRHGHIPGPGRYWSAGLSSLTRDIRQRTQSREAVTLGGEFCGEPWMGDVDLMLALSVSAERIGVSPAWEPIPFFSAVYHGSTIIFGNYAGLARPPYDEKWPPASAPADQMTLLDSQFSQQFLLEQARTFAWGMQPMLANFLPEQFEQRPQEMDFVSRMVRTRQQALKYLLHGTFLRPPSLEVPCKEVDFVQIGVYTKSKISKRTYPVALAGAWRASDGDIAIALASIHDQPLSLNLPIDAGAYGLSGPAAIFRIDETGRRQVGTFQHGQTELQVGLPARGLCVVEFSPRALR